MSIKKIFFCLGLFFIILPFSDLSSALAPMPQCLKEIEKILSSDFLKNEEMTAEQIWQIQKIENGYMLETTHFYIPVEIIPLKDGWIGPVHFEVKFDMEKLIAK